MMTQPQTSNRVRIAVASVADSAATGQQTQKDVRNLVDTFLVERDKLSLAQHIQDKADDALVEQIGRYPVLPCSFIAANTSFSDIQQNLWISMLCKCPTPVWLEK